MKPFLFLTLLIVTLTACSTALETAPAANPTAASTPGVKVTTVEAPVFATVAPPTAVAATRGVTAASTPTMPRTSAGTPALPDMSIALTVSNALYGISKTKSFRATENIVTDQGTVVKTLEYVAPDRVHETTKGGGMTDELIVIGNTTYQRAGGGAWQKYNAQMANSPLIAFGVLTMPDDISRFQNLANNFRKSGSETIDGVPTTVIEYTLASPQDQTVSAIQKIWVGTADNLPRRLQSNSRSSGSSMTITIDYRDYDSPNIKVNPPS